jgi:hypothetical protein
MSNSIVHRVDHYTRPGEVVVADVGCWYSDSEWGITVRFPEGTGRVLLSTTSRPPRGPTQSAACSGVTSRWLNSQGVKLATNLHLVPRLRMHGVAPPILHRTSWCVQFSRNFTFVTVSLSTFLGSYATVVSLSYLLRISQYRKRLRSRD